MEKTEKANLGWESRVGSAQGELDCELINGFNFQQFGRVVSSTYHNCNRLPKQLKAQKPLVLQQVLQLQLERQ